MVGGIEERGRVHAASTEGRAGRIGVKDGEGPGAGKGAEEAG